MRQPALLAASVLALAACQPAAPTVQPGAAPGTIVINGVTYATTPGAPGAPATVPGMAPPPFSGSAPGTIYGRWVKVSGDCGELADVEIGAAALTAYKPDGTVGESHPVAIAQASPNSWTVYEAGESGAARPFATATLTDPTHLTFTDNKGSGKFCALVRR